MQQQFHLPHRRFNPLTKEWILVSPHRASRPWNGSVEKTETKERPPYEVGCNLCPGNTRVSGEVNPNYQSTYVFTNDFQAIIPEKEEIGESNSPLFKNESVRGTCRVLCFSPKHNLTLAEMDEEAISKVITTWKEQMQELGKTYMWPQIFENKGEIMGCSNPHPHGQIWASNRLPTLVAKEENSQKEYFQNNRRPLLLDYVHEELEKKERVVYQNEDFAVIVPYWAVWPFEVILLPTFDARRLLDIQEEKQAHLAQAIKHILVKYDNLFETSFPYSMGIHQAPMNDGIYEHWQFHMHFYPPLLRSATVKKFMVGYEMLGESQRDLTPEKAVEHLQNISEIHYKQHHA